jgi:hypothetical protein
MGEVSGDCSAKAAGTRQGLAPPARVAAESAKNAAPPAQQVAGPTPEKDAVLEAGAPRPGGEP